MAFYHFQIYIWKLPATFLSLGNFDDWIVLGVFLGTALSLDGPKKSQNEFKLGHYRIFWLVEISMISIWNGNYR
jgi:hypothetical protein